MTREHTTKTALRPCERCGRLMSRHTSRQLQRRTCATCVKREQGKPIMRWNSAVRRYVEAS